MEADPIDARALRTERDLTEMSDIEKKRSIETAVGRE